MFGKTAVKLDDQLWGKVGLLGALGGLCWGVVLVVVALENVVAQLVEGVCDV
jgi:hypothetical protein